ncbi:HNH endonuclease signature motif containing protein [Knoellia flava]|nr:HNH endonuclease signature motif containing protein [Knoellia flava]
MNLGAVSTAVADLYAALTAPACASSGASVAGLSEPAGLLDADTLLSTIEQAQQVINICGGIQAHAMAHLAAHEEVRDVEDASGWVWKRHGLGFVADDTASLVADRLGVSVPVAANRVEDAVHQVTVTPQLVDAMGSGALDQFRAHLVTREVRDCDDDTAATIVDRLVTRATEPAPWKTTDAGADRGREPSPPRRGWDETAGPLASRTRRLVTRHAPDVAAARKKQAVKDRCLTRRAISEAADQWHGLVPVEQSLVMWQAVDSLARTLQAADPALTLDQARVDAMQQLILGQADVTIHLHATHPAAPDTATTSGTATTSDSARAATASESARAATATAAPRAATAPRGRPNVAPVNSRSATAPASAAADALVAAAQSHRDGLAERAVRGVVELGGLNRPGTTTVDLDRLPASVRLTDSTTLTCHPDTGALISGHVPKSLAPAKRRRSSTRQDAPNDEIEERYRPCPALQRLVRLRDGHCRFPGCRVPARSCDLDHVIAWPTGPTTATNLICLCRRHHRVKQRPGWTVRLDPDGVVHWSDPTGRHTTTAPVDHLDRVHHDDVREPTDDRSHASPEHASHTDDGAPADDRDLKHVWGPASRMTPAALAGLMSSPAAAPHSLAELTLARLLELARVDATHPPPRHDTSAVDWHSPDRDVLVRIGPAGCQARTGEPGPPPF